MLDILLAVSSISLHLHTRILSEPVKDFHYNLIFKKPSHLKLKMLKSDCFPWILCMCLQFLHSCSYSTNVGLTQLQSFKKHDLYQISKYCINWTWRHLVIAGFVRRLKYECFASSTVTAFYKKWFIWIFNGLVVKHQIVLIIVVKSLK